MSTSDVALIIITREKTFILKKTSSFQFPGYIFQDLHLFEKLYI